jgi:hypothetical protein
VRRVAQLSNRCVERNNTGSRVAAVSASAYSVFKKSMAGGNNPVVGSCQSYDRSASALQLLGSYDALSTGLMQMTMNWHQDHYLSGNYLHARTTLQDGLKYYDIGFRTILRNPSKYPCVLTGRDSGEPLNYVTLVRSAWAGNYNGGQMAKSCRFVDTPASPWVRGNDMPFKEGFEDMLNGNDTLARMLSGDDLEALREVLANFRGQKVPTPKLAAILGIQVDVPGSGNVDHPVPQPSSVPVPDLAPAESVVQSVALNARRQPSASASIMTTLQQGAIVTTVGRSASGWTQVQILGTRAYVKSEFLARKQPFAMAGDVANASFVNLRESAPRGRIVGTRPRGAVLTILGQSQLPGSDGLWYQVESPWNKPGEKAYWVYSGYLKVTSKAVALVRVPQ